MPTFEFTGPDGKTYEVGAPDGATQDQAFALLQSQLGQQPSKPAAVSAGQAINSIPRQIGLTARYALEGPAQAAQLVTEPLRYFTDKLVPDRGPDEPPKSTPLGVQATKLADWLGLPSPQNANERVVGDAARLVAGSGGMAGGAQLASALPGAAGRIAAAMAAQPTQQLAAAAGAGAAGGASREAGGSPLMQAGAATLGALAGGGAASAAEGAAGSASRMAARLMTPRPDQQIRIEQRLAAVLADAGTDYSTLPPDVKRSLQVEMARALQGGKVIDPAAVSRLADFRTVGATPTRGMVSQNPVQITREQNLAKMAANSADDSLSGLPMVQNENNTAIINRLNQLGAGSGTSPRQAGNALSVAVQNRQGSLRDAEQAAWESARSMPGYTQPIYPDALNAINRALGDEAMMPFMNPTISRYMEAFQTGQQPFTPQAYRNLQSMLSNELAKGGNEGAAARIARNALESAGMRPITNPGGIDFGMAPVTGEMAAAMRARDAAPGNAIDAIDAARRATRAAYQFEESSPLVRSILSEGRVSEPERIAQSYIIDGSLNEAREAAQHLGPQGRELVRQALMTHIKQKALSGSADEVGKVSQSALNNALNKIGDEKLALFFSPEDVAQLRAVGRVASYMQSQPVGSAVNNSNSGALVLGRGLDFLSQAAKLGPLGKAVVSDPLRQWQITLGNGSALNITPGLLGTQPQAPSRLTPLLLPGMAAGGALLAPQ